MDISARSLGKKSWALGWVDDSVMDPVIPYALTKMQS
jgi:hypothetical protein